MFGGPCTGQSSTQTMRAPFQDGEFPAPVKYGYLSVGRGSAAARRHLRGRTVFCLYPHQSKYVVPAHAVTVVLQRGPAQRAVLAGTVETAVNAPGCGTPRRPLIGDRVTVVGAGMVGCCVAPGCLHASPASRSPLVDVDEAPRRYGRCARCRVRAARRCRRRARPRGPHERDVGRAAAIARPARPPGAPSSSSAGTATARCTSTLGGAFHSTRPRVFAPARSRDG